MSIEFGDSGRVETPRCRRDRHQGVGCSTSLPGTGERRPDALTSLLHPDFIGHATEGLPLGMGGEHRRPRGHAARTCGGKIGKHYKVEAQPDEFRTLDDGGLFVTGHYRGRGAARRARSSTRHSSM